MTLRMRRGGGAAGGGGGTPPIYGPTDGRDAVIASVGPRTVADPGGGIAFNSSGSLQTAINNNPTSSVFVCSVNTPVWNSQVSPGTKRPTIIFPGPVGQKIINCQSGTFIPIDTGDGTTIKGGTWQNSDTTFAAIIARNDATVTDVICTDIGTASGGQGISIQGQNVLVSHCTFHSTANQGLSGIVGSHNMTVEYCEMYNNNTFQINPGNQGGAQKIGGCGDGWYHHNYAHDNIGFGMWWDTNVYDWLIEENVTENNYLSGFFFEANYGSVIRRNHIANNGRNVVIGGFPATLENTVNVRLSDNKADVTNPNGVVTPMQFTRNYIDHTGSFGGDTGALILMWDHSATTARHVGNNDVFENQFWIRSGAALGTRGIPRIRGLDTVTTGFPVWTLDNNFFTNDYHVPAGQTGTAFWMWDTGTGQGTARTYTGANQWQSFHASDNLPLQVI
jgi:hypothetical protein